MPINKQPGAQSGNRIQRSFVERIGSGRVVPVISNEALADLMTATTGRATCMN